MVGQVWEIILDARLGIRFILAIVGYTDPTMVDASDGVFVNCLILDSAMPRYGLPSEFCAGAVSVWNADWFNGAHAEAKRIA